MENLTIFLIGYGNENPEEFLNRAALAGEHCLLLDIRARRRSWAWSYTAPQVEYVVKKAGHDYIWLHELGNIGNGRGIQLANEQLGLWTLERLLRKSERPVILMCAERSSNECHRRVVAEMLAKRLQDQGDSLEIRPL